MRTRTSNYERIESISTDGGSITFDKVTDYYDGVFNSIQYVKQDSRDYANQNNRYFIYSSEKSMKKAINRLKKQLR